MAPLVRVDSPGQSWAQERVLVRADLTEQLLRAMLAATDNSPYPSASA